MIGWKDVKQTFKGSGTHSVHQVSIIFWEIELITISSINHLSTHMSIRRVKNIYLQTCIDKISLKFDNMCADELRVL